MLFSASSSFGQRSRSPQSLRGCLFTSVVAFWRQHIQCSIPISRRGLAQNRLDRRLGLRGIPAQLSVARSLPAKTPCLGLTMRWSESRSRGIAHLVLVRWLCSR
jgi:hypothetical protein